MTKGTSILHDKKIYSIEELKAIGLSYYKINQLLDNGKFIKLNKRYLENMDYNGEESDLYYVCAYAPKGIVCLMSAAAYYHLTTYRTGCIDIAIQRKSKISMLPDWPIFSVYYYSDTRFNLGVETIKEGNNYFKIYDLEKTVVDIVCYREKIGIEETKEILLNYLRREDRNLNQLIRYAKKLKCEKILKTYLEVLT